MKRAYTLRGHRKAQKYKGENENEIEDENKSKRNEMAGERTRLMDTLSLSSLGKKR